MPDRPHTPNWKNYSLLNNQDSLGILATHECSIEELATLLKLEEPTVSNHLGKLKTINLVQMRTVGNDHLFRLTASVLQSMNKDIFTFENMATLVEDFEYEDWEQKILHNFLAGELIKAIPPFLRNVWWSINGWQIISNMIEPIKR